MHIPSSRYVSANDNGNDLCAVIIGLAAKSMVAHFGNRNVPKLDVPPTQRVSETQRFPTNTPFINDPPVPYSSSATPSQLGKYR